MSDLAKKVDNAIKIIKMAATDAAERDVKHTIVNTYGGGQLIDNQLVELCYSGGKDSDVILHLARMAGIKFNAIYKNTTIDPSGTIAHVKENGVIVVKPENTFFNLVKKHGLPSRFARFCCSTLKEYKIGDVALYGIRRDESVKRAERYKEPNFCRVYKKNVKTHVWLPILEWTKDDISEFVNSEKVKCHELYYDSDGVFHAERRLGCYGCPLQSQKKRIEEFKEKPKFLRQYIKCADDFCKTHNESESVKRFDCSGTKMMFFQLFCTNIEQYRLKTTGLFGMLDVRAFMEDYFKIDLP